MGRVGPVGRCLSGGVHVVWGFDLFPPGVGAFLSVGFVSFGTGDYA